MLSKFLTLFRGKQNEDLMMYSCCCSHIPNETQQFLLVNVSSINDLGYDYSVSGSRFTVYQPLRYSTFICFVRFIVLYQTKFAI